MKTVTCAAIVLIAAGGSVAFGQVGIRQLRANLNGLDEAPAIVSTVAAGTFEATVAQDERSIDYVLAFRNLEGDVRQAHIHIGHPQNSGGVVLWLCDSEANPSPLATTPACTDADPGDARNGIVRGALTEADVQAAAANGIAPGEFAEVLALVRAGKTYVNVHSVKFPAGEIRSQLNDAGASPNTPSHQH
jgi:hypothetical protein